jgi:NAD(P)H-quinone oxidoreductase subunit 6
VIVFNLIDITLADLTIPDLIFYGVAAVTGCSAAYAVFSRNIVRAVFSLLATFFGVALIYGMLAADFVAIVQLMVYVGGILVLLLFAVMLTSQIQQAAHSNRTGGWLLGGFIGFALLVMLGSVAWYTPWNQSSDVGFDPTTSAIGEALLSRALLPFEVAAVLLVAVVIGSVVLVRRRDGEANK